MKNLSTNKKAQFDYFIEEKFTAGLILQGWEVKSIKKGNQLTLDGSYVTIKSGKVYLIGSTLPIMTESSNTGGNMDTNRSRELLLKKSEIEKLIGKIDQKGFTIIPVAVQLHNHLLKIEIALAKGKHTYDKRAVIKDREQNRETQRQIKSKR